MASKPELPNFYEEEMFTPSIVIQAVQDKDSSFEFTGFVVEIKYLITTTNPKTNQTSTRFVFLMSNGLGEILQFIAWGKLAEACDTEIKHIGQVVSFERLTVKKSEYVQSNCKFEFVITEHTKIDTLGIYSKILEDPIMPKTVVVPIKDLRSHVGHSVDITGFLTMLFSPVSETHGFYIAVMSDATYKLNVIVTKDADLPQMFLGMPVKLTGTVKLQQERIYVSSSSMKNVKFPDETEDNYKVLPIDMVLMGYNPIP